MNLLIADSGSTKTDWVFIDSNKKKSSYSGEGLNPYFSSREEISKNIKEGIGSDLKDYEVDKIIFYGSGVGTESTVEVLKLSLKENFINADIKVEPDLKGAAVACFGDSKGIACILGTGSNACVYDGTNILKKAPSLGFVLGDEGSAGYAGKQIISDYFHKTLPKELQVAIEKASDMNLESVLKKVYQEPRANSYVASFLKVLSEYKDHPYISGLVKKGFESFADKQLSYVKESAPLDVGFVGSMASIYENILREVMQERGFNVSAIIKKPIERLVEFHSKG